VTSMALSDPEIKQTLATSTPVQMPIVSFPAEHILLKEVRYSPGERKHLAKTLPWTLEEQLIDDIEDLHIATALLSNDLAVAAIVRKDLIKQKLYHLQEQNIQAINLVPEPLLLSWEAGQWTAEIQQDGKRWLLRTGAGSGFACSSDDIQLMLKLTAEDQGLPEKLIIYSDNIERDQSHLPKVLTKNHETQSQGALTEIVEWRNSIDMPSVTTAVINLLQGEFAPKIPWKKIWKQWRKTTFIVTAAILVQFVYAITDYQLAKRNDVKLRQQIEQTYRQAVPAGNMLEPVRQLKRKLANYNTTNSSHFIPVLSDVGSELAKNPSLQLQGLNYSEQKNSLQLTLLADNFNSVETLRTALEGKGLEAKLSSSNAEGEKVRARLQITGKQ
jgi:general secretion pathway protein L